MYLIQLILMGLGAAQDVRERKIYLAFPLSMLLLAAGYQVWNDGVSGMMAVLPMCGIVLVLGRVLHRSIGAGDTLVFVAVVMLLGTRGSMFVLSTASMLLIPHLIGCRVSGKMSRLEEIPLIPFMTGGYLAWMLL